jgi:hypothetical protein
MLLLKMHHGEEEAEPSRDMDETPTTTYLSYRAKENKDSHTNVLLLEPIRSAIQKQTTQNDSKQSISETGFAQTALLSCPTPFSGGRTTMLGSLQ